MTKLLKFDNIITILIIAAVALMVNVGSYGVVETSDARYAEISRTMYESGDYVHPNLLEVHHYHKPPFTYAITALGYHMFGVNAFGARFFLQLAILLQLFLIYKLTFLLYQCKKTAIWASIIYLSFPLVLIASRNLTTDAFLATFALASIYAWVKYRKEGNYLWLYIFTICLGLGFLTKGPVVFIVPVIFVFFYNYTEKAKHKFSIHHLFAWLLFLLSASSWFLYLINENPNFLDYFLGRQTVDRFSVNAFGRTEPFWYFLVLAPLVALPWFLAAVYLTKEFKRTFKFKTLPITLLASFVIPLIFFSISSSKRILYILPLYSVLAILTAHLYKKLDENKLNLIAYFIFGFSAFIAIAFVISPWLPIDFIIPKSIVLVGILLVIILWVVVRKDSLYLKSKIMAVSFITTVILLITGSYVMSKNMLEINASKPVTDFIIDHNLSDREVYVFNYIKPSIAFELNKKIKFLNNGHHSLMRETQFETDKDWKNYYYDLKGEKEIENLKYQLDNTSSVLLTYKYELPNDAEWIAKHYTNKEKMGKWTIYY